MARLHVVSPGLSTVDAAYEFVGLRRIYTRLVTSPACMSRVFFQRFFYVFNEFLKLLFERFLRLRFSTSLVARL